MTDSYLLDAGWLFFAALSVVIAVVTLKAFAPDFFSSRTPSVPRKDVGRGESPEPKGQLR